MSSRFLAVVLCVFSIYLLFSPTISQARSVLLSVGIDNYTLTGCTALSNAVNDATNIVNELANYSVMWTEREILTEAEAKTASIRSRIQTLATELTDGDTFFYFHSAHGGNTTGASPFWYLCCEDDIYRDSQLAADLAGFSSEVKVVVVTHACYSGGLFKSSGGSGSFEFGKSVLEELNRIRSSLKAPMAGHVGFIASSQEDQSSWATSTQGIFVKHFLNAISLGDVNSDGTVTFLEAFNYAKQPTIDELTALGKTQIPVTDNADVLEVVALRQYGSNELNEKLSSGCAVNEDYEGERGWVLYLPILLLLTVAIFRRTMKVT